ncbi:MAG: phenylacetate-CoA oxygenase subunit PaaI, partial [Chloroflexi bacterium]
KLVFFRSKEEYRCAQIVELPTGDWAFSMLRQFLFDAYESVLLDALSKSALEPVAATAEKILKEEIYHLRHTDAWVRRLGLGTDESHRRMQRALETLWPYTHQLFAPVPHEDLLVQAGYIPDLASIRSKWEEKVLPILEKCELRVPDEAKSYPVSRHEHTPHLEVLLSEMQVLTRMDPDAEW